MRILMLNYEYPPLGGGASPVTKSLSEELVNLGHTVDVVTMGFKGLKQKEETNGVTVYRVPSIRKEQSVCQTHEMLSYCYSAYRFLPKLLKENKYNICHTHFIIPTGVVSYLNKSKIPYIITSHGSDVPGHNPNRFSIQHELLKPFWRKIVQNAECVVTPSKYLKDMILKNVDTDNVTVIPNGFDIGSFNFDPKKKEKKILLVSRLFEFKGFQYFLDAIEDMDIDYEINIVGEGPYKEALVQKAKDLKVKVNFIGWLDNKSVELKKLYETSSIFVFPSTAENFPTVLLEAMAAGCAIITTDVCGCPEVVGDSALVVRPNSSENIRNALNKLISNDRLFNEFGNKARQRLEEKFNWKKVAKQYENIYKSEIEEKENIKINKI
ncbi:MAG: 1,2-diacylglycerol 3-glucosyltransferase [Candidatus Methanoperedens nitroreducens]|uniref:1,2-diacylglycerol 3-glucosyltransferase n=1 Tax=Candidatus Methanoperedens nitratireducens TaxID=1392998 RepID=A0A0P7ZH50_9EURY|nr:glycosyltransferase family 4 protein [Candidatus Methanoperedens sp. BLZ2]KAB2945332.1 MAG: glycosyltransferase family 4 protein [Candidatus Methanoperedens sp.]KPQ43023.1 MAG: 1,2-diacylglycerol 3-glucosyltransferase [Candidatus Methanoperedens sp. BLZ1]MBZ0176559.1 glycosyltransferase family 4 protein [Candidatus Methanoperedens nitroreducens]MCX9077877.1 glycosyltransferase family 4 protein [Candidatus Methanoperedens sp.]